MSPARRRLLVWVVVSGLALVLHAVLAPRLAAEDPIADVLLGRGGSVFALAATVMLLRIGLFVVFPAFLTTAIARLIIEEVAARALRVRHYGGVEKKG